MSAFLETAQKAAWASGKILMDNFGNVTKTEIRKKAATDFISFVDESSEKKIIETIQQSFPDHTFWAEEGGIVDNKSEYVWIIDPLDGTTNYLHSIPVFAISIALKKNNETLLGVVYDPVHDDTFYAEKGKGTFLNDKSVHVSQTVTLKESFIATGFPFKSKHKLRDYLKVFSNIFNSCIGMRRMGAAAIDLAYVACGRFDGFWEIGLAPWDIAAGKILITEAGGTFTDFWNTKELKDSSYVLATNSNIHQELGDIIREDFPFYKLLSEEL
jgi:myo-inositol-1(or 4)-monophosphatase